MTLKQGNSSIEDYQKRFTHLLPNVPCIGENPFANYSHFLGGLNQEIFYQVVGCNGLTSFEGLVNCCRQVEITISRKTTMQAVQSSSSLGNKSSLDKKKGQCKHCKGLHLSDQYH